MLGLCLLHRPPFCVPKVGALVARQEHRLVDVLVLNDFRRAFGSSTDRRSAPHVGGWPASFVRRGACTGVGAFVRLGACAGVGAFVRLGVYAGGCATPVSAFFGFEQTFVVSLGAGASWKTTQDSGRSEHQIL